MILFLIAFANCNLVDRSIWSLPRYFFCNERLICSINKWSSQWWECIVLKTFQEQDWLENFWLSKTTFYAIWQQLKPSIQTNFRETISPEQSLAVTQWLLGTTAEYRTVAHFFGIAHSTVSEIVQDTPAAIVQHLLPIYIKFPENSNLQKVVNGFYTKWSVPQCAGPLMDPTFL